ncbi:restriction system protein [Kineosphaera limosa]|uniref:Mrr restriction system protein n=1 Tax=Kineosphaera limosa NBRC 100340 TaxID=1184609 RepID=K6WZB4_9MICO|nr:restriction endonuclease [Kineosphaera limosa]NYE01660.1 restriction system protein [Kineosphaera limosa]GAB97447.1 Mrr restriction system protein [Kineosphaera limosa NBRC 100340]
MPEEASLVPTWPVFVLPTLQVLSDGKSRHRREVFDAVAEHAGVSEDARAETLKSGGPRFEQRMGWVLSHLGKAHWVDRPERGHYVINDDGRKALAKYPRGFDGSLAREVFGPYWPKKAESAAPSGPQQPSDEISDPIEVIEDAVARIEARVGDELLERLRNSHPDFFEQAVIDLLLKMGYGGVAERGRRIGGSNDEGVDGLINQDALGLDQVYIQAKRYKEGNNVGRETIQAFVGALHGFAASRGVFLTTSTFTASAVDYSKKVSSRVILIDGAKLVELMITYRVGVQEKQKFSAVDIDEDYFE